MPTNAGRLDTPQVSALRAGLTVGAWFSARKTGASGRLRRAVAVEAPGELTAERAAGLADASVDGADAFAAAVAEERALSATDDARIADSDHAGLLCRDALADAVPVLAGETELATRVGRTRLTKTAFGLADGFGVAEGPGAAEVDRKACLSGLKIPPA